MTGEDILEKSFQWLEDKIVESGIVMRIINDNRGGEFNITSDLGFQEHSIDFGRRIKKKLSRRTLSILLSTWGDETGVRMIRLYIFLPDRNVLSWCVDYNGRLSRKEDNITFSIVSRDVINSIGGKFGFINKEITLKEIIYDCSGN